MAGKSVPECPRLLELVTDVEHLPKEKLDSVLAEHKDHIKDFAYILHDKDKLADGTLKYGHWHIAMRFNRGRRISDVASWFGIPENFFNHSKTGKYDDMLAYLIHANAPDKFQYDPSEVQANFDYIEWLKTYQTSEKKKLTTKRRDEIINLIANGTIREFNIDEFVSPIEYNQFKSSIKNALEYRTIILEKQNSRDMEVIYIYGDGGTGKSTYAEEIAKKRGYSFKRSASDRDPLGSYKGQDSFVLDDARGDSFSFKDWMGILDNHQDRAGGSRFHDKIFTECKVLFITATDPPEKFWKELSADRPHEDPHQFYRRVKTVIHMTDSKIFCRRYDEKSHKFGNEFFLENDVYSRFSIQPESEEEQKEKLAHSLGIDQSQLTMNPKGISGEPIPFSKMYPTIPADVAEKIKHDPEAIKTYLREHPEHKPAKSLI